MGRGDNNSGKGGGRFKLFGVDINLQDEVYNTSVGSPLKKKRIHKGENFECKRSNKSMGNSHELCNREEQHHGLGHDDPGNNSDDLLHLQSGRPVHVRKKVIPWTPSEHKCFLTGLEMLGKGDWKGISKNYVPTKTAAQVSSHAQKYFIRIAAAEQQSQRNSPPHASTAASFNASEGSQQVMTAVVDPSKKDNENLGLDGLRANIAANEKKTSLPPETRTNASDACQISYTNSPPHAFTAESFSASESSKQVMITAVDPSKKDTENQGLDGLPANIAANEKELPFSPATRTNASDECHISYTNSPPHAFTAESFNASEGSKQVMTAAVDPSKKDSENHGLDGLPTNISANEKKLPFSPTTRTNASDACQNSHLHPFTAASFSPSEGSQKGMTAYVDPPKKYNEYHGLDGLPANIAANDKKLPFLHVPRSNPSEACHKSSTNSHLHAFTAASCSASEDFQQVMTAAGYPSKKYSEYHGLDGLPANIPANKKLLFSHATRTNASDAYHMSYTNSHLHTYTAASCSALEGSKQVMTAVDPSKKYSVYHGLDGLPANIVANEKKLLFSRVTRTNSSDACHKSYTNSHLHAFSAASFSASEGFQQVMTAAGYPSKKYSEHHGLTLEGDIDSDGTQRGVLPHHLDLGDVLMNRVHQSQDPLN